MEITYNENITIWRDVASLVGSVPLSPGEQLVPPMPSMFGPDMKISICGKWFDVIPNYVAIRTKAPDGYYRFLYIQLNHTTGEYYIGKVNRKRLSELKRYQGSGVLFKAKYKNHSEEYVRYYFAKCDTAEETERMEADIVNEELLKDPFCLNLVAGGGGTNVNPTDRREKQRAYMKEHPERYAAMLKAAKELYQSGNSSALKQRNEKTKETMSSEKYKDMTRQRIKKWKAENPEEYKKARENNRLSMQSDASKAKRNESLKKWRETHPEEYALNKSRSLKAAHSAEAEKKRSESHKKWSAEHPEQVKKRTAASAEACRKPVNMIDLDTGDVIRTFKSQIEAAEWLIEQGIAKSINCKTSISAVCLKRPCTTGYGYRKKAYGFGWEFGK